MVCRRFFVVPDPGVWSPCCSCFVLLLISLLQVSSSATSPASTRSSPPAADAFTFTDPRRSSVEYLQPPLPPSLGSKPEVGHVVRVELEFRTFIGSAPLLRRDPRRQLDDEAVGLSPPETAERHVTGCTREAEIRVQLKIGMLHVSATYDEKHVACVTVGQGKCFARPVAH